MYHLEFAPAETLKHAIKCFWYEKRDKGAGPDFEVQPDSSTEIIFYFGGECSVHKNGELVALPSPFIVGLLNEPITFHVKGVFEGLGIRCYPWTIFDLLGLQASQDKVKIFSHPIAKLQAVLEEYIMAGQIEKAVRAIEKYFLENIPAVPPNDPIAKAGNAIMKTKGNLPVSKVASEAFATVRTLERQFKRSSGHTIKDVAGLVRFEQARNRLWNDPDTLLSTLAYELGYTDQAHLSRDFKKHAGTTPAAFAKKRAKEKLAQPGNFVVFVQT